MKPFLAAMALSIFCSANLLAQTNSFNISAERKRYEVERTMAVDKATSKEKWGFHVTVENKSFKDQTNVSVEYQLFMKDVPIGAKAAKMAVKRQKGNTAIPNIKNGEKFQFDTDPVVLDKSHLVGGYIYTDGAKPRQGDTLDGVWIRVMLDGKVVGEFTYPATLKTKEKWEE